MKKLIFTLLIIALAALIYHDTSKPDFVKINEQEVEQCSRAMEKDPYFVCD